MKFKLGLLIGAGVSYLASSGKGKELLAQFRERTGAGEPDPGSDSATRSTGLTGRPTTTGSGFPDPGCVPDAFGTTVVTEEETIIIETDELGSTRR